MIKIQYFYGLELLRNIFEIFIPWLYQIKIEQKHKGAENVYNIQF